MTAKDYIQSKFHVPSPNLAQLRRFGLLMGAVAASVFAFHLIFADRQIHRVALAAALVFLGLAAVRPLWLRRVYFAWMILAEILGYVNSRIILTLVFVLVIVPIAWIQRAVGKDKMTRRFERGLNTYRIEPSVEAPPDDMERTF